MLSLVIGFLATIISVMRSIIANLTPASRRQDHTTSPYATSPLVHAPKHMTTPPRPPHPDPNVRDDRETPLSSGGTAGIKKVICMKREGEKFLKKGLDRPFAKQPDGQISWLPFTSPHLR